VSETNYPRDLRGYGRNPPDPRWPGNARVAVQFVVNFEEGGENNILHGDRASEAFLSDVLGAQPRPGQRHANIESMFEYGSRAGFWRLWRIFTERKLPTTVFGVATALQRNPEVVAAMQEAGWDIASHSLKWVEHKDMSEAEERAGIAEAIRVHTEATGQRPLGWYTGRSSINTVRDSFEVLYAEGETSPKMMSVGLHCRLVGRPGRAASLMRFLDYVGSHARVWVPTRLATAQHWHANLSHLAENAVSIG